MSKSRIVEYNMVLICRCDILRGDEAVLQRVMDWCLARPGLLRAFHKRRGRTMHRARISDVIEMARQFDAEAESEKALKAINNMLDTQKHV